MPAKPGIMLQTLLPDMARFCTCSGLGIRSAKTIEKASVMQSHFLAQYSKLVSNLTLTEKSLTGRATSIALIIKGKLLHSLKLDD